MSYFPLFFDLKNKHILVVGAGTIASRRIRGLAEAGARVLVIAPDFQEETLELAERNDVIVELQRSTYEAAEDLQLNDYFLICAATGDADLDRRIVEDAGKAGVPANAASDRALCDFYFPGLVKDENLIIGVSSGGRDHAKVARVCKNIRENLEEITES